MHYDRESIADCARYYAQELLITIFGQDRPSQQEVAHLANVLKSQSCDLSHFSEIIHPDRRALIISSDLVEQNVIAMVLLNQRCDINQIRTKKEFIDICSQKKKYDVVVVSDFFTEIGVNLLSHASLFFADVKALFFVGNSFRNALPRRSDKTQFAFPFPIKDFIQILPNGTNN